MQVLTPFLTTGYGISASHLGRPDAEIYTMTENLQVVRQIANVTDIPVIADTDTGYGNAINVIRTVKEFERAGVAAMIFEDQIAPKRCPACVDTFNVISIEEAVGKIKAAVDARWIQDLVIVARKPMPGRWKRLSNVARLTKRPGADVIQPISKAVTNLEEMRRFKAEVKRPSFLADTGLAGKRARPGGIDGTGGGGHLAIGSPDDCGPISTNQFEATHFGQDHPEFAVTTN
jgi:2-methylisocitrate lyase-like PEP mutase family enzyme